MADNPTTDIAAAGQETQKGVGLDNTVVKYTPKAYSQTVNDFASASSTNEEIQNGALSTGDPNNPNDPRNFNGEIVVTGSKPTTFNINNFRTEIDNYGTVATHSYLVRFAPFRSYNDDGNANELTKALNSYMTINKDKLIMRCDNAILPGVSIIKEEAVRRYGYGPTEIVPYNVNFGDFTLQWIVDSNSEIVDFFNKWINLIVNHDSKGGADMISHEFSAYEPYEVGFKDDYSNSKVSVFVYDRQLNTTIEYNIFDAFPISIQSINMAWNDENQLMKYNVTFAFTDMIMKTPKAGDNALYITAQQDAIARASTKSPDEEKANPGDIAVTALQRSRQSASGPIFGDSQIVGDYTIAVPPYIERFVNNTTKSTTQPPTTVNTTIP